MLITNISEQESLFTRLDNLIGESEEMRVLVGFFYFWGIGALHQGLSNNRKFRLRILVGMEAEEHAGKLVEVANGCAEGTTDDEHRVNFLTSLATVMRSREIDRQDYYERVSLFVDLVRNGQIGIRKTRDPNHAKLYHFSFNKNLAKVLHRDYCWITGSSNLTRPGLIEQKELNVQLLDFGGDESRQYFDALWENAVPLTDDEETKQRILELVGGDESIITDVTPFEAYALVLKNYLEHRELVDKTPSILRIFTEPKNEEGENKYRPFSFQVDAINQALSILQEYNGVIIADVVGLGKSVVGSVLGRLNGKRGLVIAPPGLVGDYNAGTGWWGYLQDFKLHEWRAVSRGKMEEVLRMVNRQRDFEVILVDEAHYFRNQDSEDYHYLSQICRGKQVILMTATPYSNRPSDMLALLKLFSPARQSMLTPDGNLEALFRYYQTRYRHIDYVLKHLGNSDKAERVAGALENLGITLGVTAENYVQIRQQTKILCRHLAGEIRQVVEPIMIRRNRLDLCGDPGYAEEVGNSLGTMHDPIEQFYELTSPQSQFYDRVITEYFGENSEFSGAAYQPGAYVKGAPQTGEDETDPEQTTDTANVQQKNMYKFIRRLLVRRFESSFGAFEKTLDNLIRTHKHIRRLATPAPLGRGLVVLDRKMMETLLNLEDAADDEVDALLQAYEDDLNLEGAAGRKKNLQIFRVSEDFDDAGRDRFFAELGADINLLQQVKKQVEDLGLIANDPKATKLVKEIGQVLAGNHPAVAVNSEEPRRKVLVFTEFSDTVEHLHAYLEAAFPGQVLTIRTLGKEMAKTVLKNFDGSCNKGLRQDQFKILLATDKMSEGFNLNRAGVVINYDIPWNPTRVIQRVGRINRIGIKVFEDLYLFNFFPTEQGATAHNVRQIATNKMFMIHTSIGEDSKIFAADEEPTPAGLYEKLSRNPDELEEESFLTQAKREWAEIQKDHPQVAAKVGKLPGRVKTTREQSPTATYLFVRKGMSLFALRRDGDPAEAILHLPIQEAMGEIKCCHDTERAADFSPAFWDNYQALQNSLFDREHNAIPGTGSLIVRARNALLSAMSANIGQGFAEVLLDDIQNYGTLSERTLRKLVNAAGNSEKMQAVLAELEDEMGADYLAPIKLKMPPNEILIAVEHQ